MLTLHNVSKVFTGSFGTVQALKDVDLNVAPGEVIVLRGPSGCGKTTLLLMAGAMMTPTAGTVKVAGENPYVFTPGQRARLRQTSIGFVFQQFNLIPYLSVLENVMTPARTVLSAGQAKKRAAQLLVQFDLMDRADHQPAQLSAGQQQRTALARAMINQPKLVLADEPTGNLDKENARIVIDHLCDIAQAGTAVVIVTHDTGLDKRQFRTLNLKNGAIVEAHL